MRSSTLFTHIFNNFGPNLDLTGPPRPIFLRGKLPQLGVEVDPVDGVHGHAPGGLAVLVVLGDQDLHVRAIDQTAVAYRDHARFLWHKVPGLEHPRRVGLDCDGRPNLVHQRGLLKNLSSCMFVRGCGGFTWGSEWVLTVTLWPALRRPIPVLRPAIPAPTMMMSITSVYEELSNGVFTAINRALDQRRPEFLISLRKACYETISSIGIFYGKYCVAVEQPLSFPTWLYAKPRHAAPMDFPTMNEVA